MGLPLSYVMMAVPFENVICHPAILLERADRILASDGGRNCGAGRSPRLLTRARNRSLWRTLLVGAETAPRAI